MIGQSGQRVQRITNWANNTGVAGFFTNPEYRGMMGKHRDLGILSDHVTNSCQIEHKKVIDVYLKVTDCSFNLRQNTVM